MALGRINLLPNQKFPTFPPFQPQKALKIRKEEFKEEKGPELKRRKP